MASSTPSFGSLFSDSNSTLIAPTDANSLQGRTDPITPDQYYTAKKCVLAFRCVIVLVGMSGNALNIRTFLRMGVEDSVTVVFFTLAITDLNVLIFDFGYVAGGIFDILENDFKIPFVLKPTVVAILFRNARSIFLYIAALLTMFLAIQKGLCVLIPLRFKRVFTRKRTIGVVLFIWVYCFACGLMYLSQMRVFKVRSTLNLNLTNYALFISTKHKDLLDGTIIMNNIVLNPMCQLATLACVVVMANALKRSARFRHQRSSAKEEEDSNHFDNTHQAKSAPTKDQFKLNSKEIQAIRQVLIVTLFFVFTNGPNAIRTVISMISPMLFHSRKYYYSVSLALLVVRSFPVINSAVNFFIYYKYSTKFRQHCFSQRREQTET